MAIAHIHAGRVPLQRLDNHDRRYLRHAEADRLPPPLLACAGPVAALAAAPTDLPALEQAWHGCVREAYRDRPRGTSRAAAQLNALDACREHEDALVAAVMAAPVEDDRPLSARAKAWASRVAAYVWDPVTSWVGSLRPMRLSTKD